MAAMPLFIFAGWDKDNAAFQENSMTLKRNLGVVIFCESIKKTPINTQAEVQTRVRLVRSGKIIMPETQPIFNS